MEYSSVTSVPMSDTRGCNMDTVRCEDFDARLEKLETAIKGIDANLKTIISILELINTGSRVMKILFRIFVALGTLGTSGIGVSALYHWWIGK